MSVEPAIFKVVRGAGLEPAQYCYRQDLNLVRLPISPPARLKQNTGPRHHPEFIQCPAELPPEIGQLSILTCNKRLFPLAAEPRGSRRFALDRCRDY